jgi:hypothetical protein
LFGLSGILLATIAVQVLHPSLLITLPAPPWGAIVVFLPLALLTLGRWRWGRCAALGSIPVAVLALLAVALTAAPAAIWPTGTSAPPWLARWGFADSTASLPFAAAITLLLVNLSVSGAALVAARHPAWPVIALVHGGLILAMGAAATGAGNTVRARVWLTEGAPPATVARDVASDASVPLPLPIQLDDFQMDRWEPTLIVGHHHNGRWQYDPGTVPVRAGSIQHLGPYRVTIDTVLERVAVDGATPRPFLQPGAGPAARITVTDAQGATLGSGWVHAPTAYGEALLTPLGGGAAVLMQPHRAKAFRSQVRIGGEPALIEVNRPLLVDGWWLYQTGYDEADGPGSVRSQLEVVRDPGLYGVYAGCALIIAGILVWLWGLGALVRSSNSAVSP